MKESYISNVLEEEFESREELLRELRRRACSLEFYMTQMQIDIEEIQEEIEEWEE